MKNSKLPIADDKFDINLKFYFLLKYLVKSKLTSKQSMTLYEILFKDSRFDRIYPKLINHLESINSRPKKENLENLFFRLKDELDLDLLRFSLNLLEIKGLLLAEAKLKQCIQQRELSKLNPLSLEYDNKSIYSPYTTRVNGALLSLLFFEKLEEGDTSFIALDTNRFLEDLVVQANKLKLHGLEPNQIFMLMFNESINQSIISESGTNYEDRIFSVLIDIGIDSDKIKKIHDDNDVSMEYDFFFEIDGKTYGIGAKRTLRERYKQFIKTNYSSHIDVMIQMTLGLDLNVDKAKTIIKHDTILFVADEVYQSRDYLKELNGVYSVKDFNLKTLKSFVK